MGFEQRRAVVGQLVVHAQSRRNRFPPEDLVHGRRLLAGRVAARVEQILRGEIPLAVVVADAHVNRRAADLVGVVCKHAERLHPAALGERQLGVSVGRRGTVGVDVVVQAVGVLAQAAVVLHTKLEVVVAVHEVVGEFRDRAGRRRLRALAVVPRVDATGNLSGVEVIEATRHTRAAVQRIAVVDAVESRIARFDDRGGIEHRGPQQSRRRVMTRLHNERARRRGG